MKVTMKAIILHTTSSRRTSMKAENSNRRNLLVAIVRPSHDACADGCPASISPDIAVAGLPPYGCCENGLMLWNDKSLQWEKKSNVRKLLYPNTKSVIVCEKTRFENVLLTLEKCLVAVLVAKIAAIWTKTKCLHLQLKRKTISKNAAYHFKFRLNFAQFSSGQHLYVWTDLFSGPRFACSQFDVPCY